MTFTSVTGCEFYSQLKLGLDASGKCRVYSSEDLNHARYCDSASSFKIAIVKQDCYGDLWIGSSSDTPVDLLLSTQMRVGPLALISGLGADFHIIQLEDDSSVQLFRSQVLIEEGMIDEIRDYRFSGSNLQPDVHKPFSDLAQRKHSEYSVSASNVDWGRYHMVVSINASVNRRLRKKFSNTVWITIPGEGLLTYGCLEWDYCVTHNCPTAPSFKSKFLNIPYTFLRPTELKDIIKELGLESAEKSTIYLEINSCPVHIRPPTFKDSCYAQELQANIGLPVRIHPSTMYGHLKELSAAKYFIKTGGRPTRGNSFFEAISAGVVVLLKVDDCFGNINLPEGSYFRDFDDLLLKLKRLEADPRAYNNLLAMQYEFISAAYFYSLSQLSEAYNEKKFPRLIAKLIRFGRSLVVILRPVFMGSACKMFARIRACF